MTRVLVVNAFERGNRGDAALLSVLLDQIRRALPGARIAIAGFEHPSRWPEFEGVPNLGSFRRYSGEEDIPRFRRILRKLSLLPVLALAAARLPRRPLLADVLTPRPSTVEPGCASSASWYPGRRTA
ncbi:hypothetical protein, partial [Amycolatopsis sp. NPDC000740]|uniref:hypothetical protein n=1 Tax=Amycolatopsis sp. NPDC000740 TaxID=3154269 RepID=UPI00332A34F3